MSELLRDCPAMDVAALGSNNLETTPNASNPEGPQHSQVNIFKDQEEDIENPRFLSRAIAQPSIPKATYYLYWCGQELPCEGQGPRGQTTVEHPGRET